MDLNFFRYIGFKAYWVKKKKKKINNWIFWPGHSGDRVGFIEISCYLVNNNNKKRNDLMMPVPLLDNSYNLM